MTSTYAFSSFARRQEDVTPSSNGDKLPQRQASTSKESALQRELLDNTTPESQVTSPTKNLVHRELSGIQTRDSPNQNVHRRPPAVAIINQKRRYEVIDLTEDDDEEPSTPRKKSRSSSDSDSSDKSLKLINNCRPIATKPVKWSPQPSHTKPKGMTPLPALHSSQQLSHEWQPSQSVASYTISSRISSQRPSSKRDSSNHRQYASAVVVHSNAQPFAKPPATPEEELKREQFLKNLQIVPNITLANDIDNSSPSLSFHFVNESVLREGVTKADEGFMSGCGCRKKRGSNECKYPNECQCLQDSAGEVRVKKGQYHDAPHMRGCLVKSFLESRFHIFECNSKCDCGQNCKNRVVQHGRKIKIELFKTDNRGWGLRTMEPIQRGQFIDTYRGEIITQEEADRRSKGRGADKDNYLFDFDKFPDPQYVCDGEYMGGPTRFMNHSCDPNCAMFTVSFNHADPNIYELAFFAKEAIPAGAELTFDYQEEDEEPGARRRITDEMAAQMEKEKGYAPSKCLCGSWDCRGYFFFSK